MTRSIPLAFLLLFCPFAAPAEVISVAVASNFYPVLKIVSGSFTTDTNIRMRIISGSTGTLYSQILHGAPWDVFLAADRERPRRLESEGRAVASSRRTYALGRLVFWAPRAQRAVDERFLREYRGRIAIANPVLAPYGVAARQVLMKTGAVDPDLVRGNNISQAFQFIRTGNTPAGFIALSQAFDKQIDPAHYWIVDENYYDRLEQQLVLLKPSVPARTFVQWLLSPATQSLLQEYGYHSPLSGEATPS